MRLPENLKEILRSLNKAKEAGDEEVVRHLVEKEEEEREVVEVVEVEEEDLHSLPAGVWPKQVNECLCKVYASSAARNPQTISNFYQ